MSLIPSGPSWCEKFPTSNLLSDLISPFKQCVVDFTQALRNAGGAVTINATYRPPERAYLMHYACCVAGYTPHGSDQPIIIGADSVPPMEGVAIDWTHGGDDEAARKAAAEMVKAYDIAFPAALVSRHTQRMAVDMTIHWAGIIRVRDARGIERGCAKQEDLWPIGATYKVFKLASDVPHWSSDGH